MKRRIVPVALGVAALAALAAVGQALGAYSLLSNAITAGSAVAMSAGAYQLSAGIETTGAGRSQGGAYTLTAGFFVAPGAPTVDVPSEDAPIPPTTALLAISPTPFTASTSIAFDLAEAADARVEIFDVAGRRVRTLLDGRQAPGRYTVTWSGTDESGRGVASGVYLLRFQSGRVADTRRIVKIR